jgi:hypothetical protein
MKFIQDTKKYKDNFLYFQNLLYIFLFSHDVLFFIYKHKILNSLQEAAKKNQRGKLHYILLHQFIQLGSCKAFFIRSRVPGNKQYVGKLRPRL